MTESPAERARHLADTIEASLRASGTPERAEAEKRYLKSDLDFFGATVPQTNAAVRTALADLPPLDHATLAATVERLWGLGVFECRMAAVELLSLSAYLLHGDDLPWLQRLIRESGTWALVDGLAASVIGSIVERDPDSVAPTLDRWAGEEDFWVRRVSLLGELRLVRAGDEPAFRRFTTRAEPMLEETEFFIRKAIGWVLREAGKKRSGEVVAWLEPRVARASGVTMREAVKYLPEEDATRLMNAHRTR